MCPQARSYQKSGIMKYQALAYVQRKRITDWKRLVLTGDSLEFLYGSNDDQVFSELPDGSVLWIIASLPDQPPELVAKLEVEKIRERDSPDLGIDNRLLWHFREFGWIAKATSNSVFFGHNNAGDALVRTLFDRPSGDPWSFSSISPVWLPKFGMSLHRPKRIHSVHGSPGTKKEEVFLNPIEELAEKSSHSVFISWKWMDNTSEKPLKLAELLANRGFMVWLDLLALPKSRALKKVQSDHKKLEKLLKYGYEQCKYILAINSENYGSKTSTSEKNWTLREWNGEIAKNTKLIRFCLTGIEPGNREILSSTDFIINDREPEAMVNTFTETVNMLESVAW